MVYSEILNPTPTFDPELSKLGGLQFMPFEPRELPFENLDPLNPLTSLSNFTDIASLLRYRGQTTPKQTAFVVLDQKGREAHEWTWEKLHLKAEKMAQSNVMAGSATDAKMREYLNGQRKQDQSQQQSQSDNDGSSYISGSVGGGNEMGNKIVDTVLSYLEPRQQVGLILGALWGVYRGNITIFL